MTLPVRCPSSRLLATGLLCLGLLAGAVVPAAAESDMAWSTLSIAQRAHLEPLQREWSTIDPARKEKWLRLAERLDTMPAAERQRIQRRMADWARMPDGERMRARQQFQEARQLSVDERKARWLEYQALPAEQRRELASQARQRQREQRDAANVGEVSLSSSPQSKGNIMPLPDSRRGRIVAPAVVQAHPGATTNPLSKSPEPAPFQQSGLPKIAATPDFVDPTTLLPRRGAQAAATVEQRSGNSDPKPAK